MSQDLHHFAQSVAWTLTEAALRDKFAGYDPFDGLNSRLFKALGLHRSRVFRLAWLQFFKLSPVNLRAIAGVPKSRNAKTIAVFLLAMCQRYRRTGDQNLLPTIANAAQLLCDERIDSRKWGGSCWGYPFPWQARAFFVPVGTPNAIASAYSALALTEAAEITGEDRFLKVAVDASLFFDRTLFVGAGSQSYFQYIPGEAALVHNANLWAAHAAIHGALALGDRGAQERALQAVRNTTSCQRGDGAWLYGDRSHHQFIDGFHTGYNLEVLFRLSRVLNTPEFDPAIEKGVRYYQQAFLRPDGAVAYFNDRLYPLDSHAFAQATITMCMLPQASERRQLAARVVSFALSQLFLPRKCRFVYLKRRFFVNRVEYVRWTQAWMAYALEYWARFEALEARLGRSFDDKC